MDPASRFSISAPELYARLGTATAPLVIDLRSADAFTAGDRMIVGAVRRVPDDIERWAKELSRDRAVVAYCVRGGATSQNAAALLREGGITATYLEGGIEAWAVKGLPCRHKRDLPRQWVTRERPKVDRIACPWLIRRFIDPEAEFLYVPAATVRDVAAQTGATPYDIANVEFGHVGEQCSFDAFIRIFAIADPALDRLALIVRGADTGKPELTPQSPGLIALSQGLSAAIGDDLRQLAHGLVMYDALYAWCRQEAGAPIATAA